MTFFRGISDKICAGVYARSRPMSFGGGGGESGQRATLPRHPARLEAQRRTDDRITEQTTNNKQTSAARGDIVRSDRRSVI
jgi:hypothetical protein